MGVLLDFIVRERCRRLVGRGWGAECAALYPIGANDKELPPILGTSQSLTRNLC